MKGKPKRSPLERSV